MPGLYSNSRWAHAYAWQPERPIVVQEIVARCVGLQRLGLARVLAAKSCGIGVH